MLVFLYFYSFISISSILRSVFFIFCFHKNSLSSHFEWLDIDYSDTIKAATVKAYLGKLRIYSSSIANIPLFYTFLYKLVLDP